MNCFSPKVKNTPRGGILSCVESKWKMGGRVPKLGQVVLQDSNCCILTFLEKRELADLQETTL